MIVEIATNPPKINVWCPMSSKQIIDPWFFDEDTINQRKLFKYVKRLFLSNFTLHKRIIFQKDGVPAHFSKEVHTRLNENFKMINGHVEVDQFLGRRDLQI